MLELFTTLNAALQGTFLLALLASFAWGILSILLSPCHLSSIPLVVGYMSGGTSDVRRSFLITLAFSAGILTTIAAIGILTGLLGRMLGDIGPWGSVAVGVIFILVGLYLLGVLPLPFLNQGSTPGVTKRGYRGALLLGLIFGTGVGACTFAYMAPILGIIFKEGQTDLDRAAFFLGAYAVGHCGVIVLAGTFFETLRRYLKWNEKTGALGIVKRVCGALVIVAGLYLAWNALEPVYFR